MRRHNHPNWNPREEKRSVLVDTQNSVSTGVGEPLDGEVKPILFPLVRQNAAAEKAAKKNSTLLTGRLRKVAAVVIVWSNFDASKKFGVPSKIKPNYSELITRTNSKMPTYDHHCQTNEQSLLYSTSGCSICLRDHFKGSPRLFGLFRGRL